MSRSIRFAALVRHPRTRVEMNPRRRPRTATAKWPRFLCFRIRERYPTDSGTGSKTHRRHCYTPYKRNTRRAFSERCKPIYSTSTTTEWWCGCFDEKFVRDVISYYGRTNKYFELSRDCVLYVCAPNIGKNINRLRIFQIPRVAVNKIDL